MWWSWVAISTVVPVRLIRSNKSMMSLLVSGSRFPVGSSASSTSGRLTNARAMATRRVGLPGGLVAHHYQRPVPECPADAPPLLLTARQLVRQPAGLAGQPDHF